MSPLYLMFLTTMLLFRGDSCKKTKRSLIYPRPNGKVQAIMGAGFPVDLRDESVIVGIVVKASYQLPTNSSIYTNPTVVYARKKRAMSRWNIYSLIAQASEMYGLGGKACILKAICDCASIPIEKSNGLIAEIFHSIFTPTTTRDELNHYTDNEYYAAHHIGTHEQDNCHRHFPECKGNLLDLFTKLDV